MGLFKSKSDENWKINYIKEFNEMRSEYEKKLLFKQNEIDDLKKQLEELKSFRGNLRPKEKQIKDSDIESIKELRNQGFSYREISQKVRKIDTLNQVSSMQNKQQLVGRGKVIKNARKKSKEV